MKTLTIKDLARNEQLDGKAMASVRGGWKMDSKYCKPGDMHPAGNFDSSITATQELMQSQKVFNSTANGSAFLHNIDVHNDVSQDGKNVIVG